MSFLTLTPSPWTNDPSAVFTAAELRVLLRWLPFTRGFGGHTTRAYVGYERATDRPVRYFTFLRDPIERYISHLEYQRARMGIPWSLETFLNEPRFSNFMTTRIAGVADVGRAKELLRERFAFVGLTERFDESLLLMRQALRLSCFDIRYERKNVGQRQRLAEERDLLLDGRDALARIKSQNLLDLELYEFARTTLYPEYVSRYGPELGGDVERFRGKNAGFRFSRSRRYSWALYRKLGYQPLEAIARKRHRPLAGKSA